MHRFPLRGAGVLPLHLLEPRDVLVSGDRGSGSIPRSRRHLARQLGAQVTRDDVPIRLSRKEALSATAAGERPESTTPAAGNGSVKVSPPQ